MADQPNSEYCDVAQTLGYNPEPSPMLHYSDSSFYCSKCREYNFVDSEELLELINDNMLKVTDYKLTNRTYLFKNNYQKDDFTFEQNELYDLYNTKKGPNHLLSYYEKLIDFCMIDKDDVYCTDAPDCFQYYPYAVHEQLYNQ